MLKLSNDDELTSLMILVFFVLFEWCFEIERNKMKHIIYNVSLNVLFQNNKFRTLANKYFVEGLVKAPHLNFVFMSTNLLMIKGLYLKNAISSYLRKHDIDEQSVCLFFFDKP